MRRPAGQNDAAMAHAGEGVALAQRTADILFDEDQRYAFCAHLSQSVIDGLDSRW